MHALLRFAPAALLLAATTALAADDQQSGSGQSSGGQQAVKSTKQENSNSTARRWRYRHHGGRWWYYTPANNWVVWQNNAWVPYQAGMFAGGQRMTSQTTPALLVRSRLPRKRELLSPRFQDSWRLRLESFDPLCGLEDKC